MSLLGLGRHGLTPFEQVAILGVIATAIISLLYAWYLRNRVMKKGPPTNAVMIPTGISVGASTNCPPMILRNSGQSRWAPML